MGEQTSSQKEEKCGWGPDYPFCKAQKKDADLPHQQDCPAEQQQEPLPRPKAKRPNTKYNLDCFLTLNLTLNGMKMSNINMNMVMKHLFEGL